MKGYTGKPLTDAQLVERGWTPPRPTRDEPCGAGHTCCPPSDGPPGGVHLHCVPVERCYGCGPTMSAANGHPPHKVTKRGTNLGVWGGDPRGE